MYLILFRFDNNAFVCVIQGNKLSHVMELWRIRLNLACLADILTASYKTFDCRKLFQVNSDHPDSFTMKKFLRKRSYGKLRNTFSPWTRIEIVMLLGKIILSSFYSNHQFLAPTKKQKINILVRYVISATS